MKNIIINITLITVLYIYYGFNLDKTNSLPKLIIGGYLVSLAFVGVGYFAILIIFDFIIKCTLKIKLKVEKE